MLLSIHKKSVYSHKSFIFVFMVVGISNLFVREIGCVVSNPHSIRWRMIYVYI